MGGRKARSLDKTPVFLEMVLAMDVTWLLQLSLSSKTTPRKVVEWTLVMGVSSILMEEQEKGDLLHLLKNIQFVLLGFRDSLLDLNQEETLMSSMLTSTN